MALGHVSAVPGARLRGAHTMPHPKRTSHTARRTSGQVLRFDDLPVPASHASDPIPITVWPATHQQPRERGHRDLADGLPPGIAERVLATFTRAGDLVVTLDPLADVVLAAVSSARRCTAFTTTVSDASALADRAESAAPATRRGQARVLESTPAEMVSTLWRHRHRAHLILARLPRPVCNTNVERSGGESPVSLEELLDVVQVALRPGGHFLAIVSPPPASPPDDQSEDILDAPGRIITTARDMGLAYLQHIVAVHTPIHGDAFDTGGLDLTEEDTAADNPMHIRAHTDLLVFQNRAAEQAAAA